VSVFLDCLLDLERKPDDVGGEILPSGEGSAIRLSNVKDEVSESEPEDKQTS